MALTATLLGTPSCGVFDEIKMEQSSDRTIPSSSWTTKEHFDFYRKHHGKTKRETEKIFRIWVKENNLEKNVTRSTLERISFTETDCRLTFAYRLFDGRTGKVTITTDDFKISD